MGTRHSTVPTDQLNQIQDIALGFSQRLEYVDGLNKRLLQTIDDPNDHLPTDESATRKSQLAAARQQIVELSEEVDTTQRQCKATKSRLQKQIDDLHQQLQTEKENNSVLLREQLADAERRIAKLNEKTRQIEKDSHESNTRLQREINNLQLQNCAQDGDCNELDTLRSENGRLRQVERSCIDEKNALQRQFGDLKNQNIDLKFRNKELEGILSVRSQKRIPGLDESDGVLYYRASPAVFAAQLQSNISKIVRDANSRAFRISFGNALINAELIYGPPKHPLPRHKRLPLHSAPKGSGNNNDDDNDSDSDDQGGSGFDRGARVQPPAGSGNDFDVPTTAPKPPRRIPNHDGADEEIFMPWHDNSRSAEEVQHPYMPKPTATRPDPQTKSTLLPAAQIHKRKRTLTVINAEGEPEDDLSRDELGGMNESTQVLNVEEIPPAKLETAKPGRGIKPRLAPAAHTRLQSIIANNGDDDSILDLATLQLQDLVEDGIGQKGFRKAGLDDDLQEEKLDEKEFEEVKAKEDQFKEEESEEEEDDEEDLKEEEELEEVTSKEEEPESQDEDSEEEEAARSTKKRKSTGQNPSHFTSILPSAARRTRTKRRRIDPAILARKKWRAEKWKKGFTAEGESPVKDQSSGRALRPRGKR